MKWGEDIPAEHDLSSLRVLGSVGEPINPEAWIWYRRVIGGDRTPVVDTWWQTETGAIMISPLPGRHRDQARLGDAGRCPASAPTSSTTQGTPVPNGGGGFLVLTEPWPSMLRGIWGDDERYRETYWSRFAEQGYYFAGDGAKKDDDGDLWLLGRVDDVMNISGHRISTTEVESALVSHPSVAEAAVVGATDPTTGQAIVAFVILRGDVPAEEAEGAELIKTLRNHVGHRDRRRSPSRARSWSCPSCPRPAAARSCAGCCATWPRTARSATSPRWPTPPSWTSSARSCPTPPPRSSARRFWHSDTHIAVGVPKPT